MSAPEAPRGAETLRECPFCGSPGVMKGFYAACGDETGACWIRGEITHPDRWNRRALPTVAPALSPEARPGAVKQATAGRADAARTNELAAWLDSLASDFKYHKAEAWLREAAALLRGAR